MTNTVWDDLRFYIDFAGPAVLIATALTGALGGIAYALRRRYRQQHNNST